MDNNDKRRNDWVQLSGLGVQMVAIIGLCVFIGYKLDQGREGKPWWTLGLSITGVIIAMVYLIRTFNKTQK